MTIFSVGEWKRRRNIETLSAERAQRGEEKNINELIVF